MNTIANQPIRWLQLNAFGHVDSCWSSNRASEWVRTWIYVNLTALWFCYRLVIWNLFRTDLNRDHLVKSNGPLCIMNSLLQYNGLQGFSFFCQSMWRTKRSTVDGYFLAGRNMTWWPVSQTQMLWFDWKTISLIIRWRQTISFKLKEKIYSSSDSFTCI